MNRDFDRRPYSAEEQRVCEYIQRITGGVVGCGDDPVGFLLASHETLSRDLTALRKRVSTPLTSETEPVDLGMLDALEREATPAPWHYSGDREDDFGLAYATVGPHPGDHYEDTVAAFYSSNMSPMEFGANVRLTCALRNSAAALVSELMALRARVTRRTE